MNNPVKGYLCIRSFLIKYMNYTEEEQEQLWDFILEDLEDILLEELGYLV